MIWELQHLIKYSIKGLVVVLNKLLSNYLMASKILDQVSKSANKS